MAWEAAAAGGSLLGTLYSGETSAKEARKNRDFQAHMSSTAHQREVADLRLAGLNPILSAQGSGASTPSGATADVPDYGKSATDAISSAVSIRQQKKQFEQIDTGIENTNADIENKKETAKLIANQVATSALDVKSKEMQNKLMKETLPAAIKKAKTEGDYSEVKMIMDLINSGANSAGALVPIQKLMPKQKPLTVPKKD